MLSDEFGLNEFLFRAVSDIQFDFTENRVSSAAFKDSNGVSVDRQGKRDTTKCISAILAREKFKNSKAIVNLTYDFCVSKNAMPKYDRLDDNIFHSLLIRPDGTIKLSDGTAKQLSRAPVCYLREESPKK